MPDDRSATPCRTLCQNFHNRLAVVFVDPFASRNGEAARVQAELMQDRRVDVSYIVPILNRVEPELIGCTMSDAAPDAAASHPNAKAVRMMIPAVAEL
jgi:hypothetical protein